MMSRFASLRRASGRAATLSLALAAACGGKVIVDGAAGSGGAPVRSGDGGATAASSVVASSSVAVNATTTTSYVSTSSSSGGGGAPPIPALVRVDLGMLGVGMPTGFDLQPNLLGMTAIALTQNAWAQIGFASLVAPDGTELISSFGIPTTMADFEGFGVTTFLVPQTDASEEMPVASGPWKLTLGASGTSGGASAHVSLWLRQTVDGAFHGGVIDVNVFAVPGLASDGYYHAALTKAFAGYAGLSLGAVHVLPLDKAYSIIDDSNFYQALAQTVGAPGKPALNVLAVSYLTGSLEGAAGVTPGAPAVTLEPGTHQSGLFWAVYGDLVMDQMILRHETGHMAGLFHTTELKPGLGDALTDTPRCENMSDIESCPDYDNLMFPSGGSGMLALSAMQLHVIEGSALYRGIVEEGGAPATPLDSASSSSSDSASSPSPEAPPGGPTTLRAMELAAPWADRVPRAAAAWLVGVGCGPGTVAGAPDFATTLFALGGGDAAALVAIGTDRSAPAHVRQRALAAAGRVGLTAGEAAAVSNVARSPLAPRAARLGAMRGLALGSPSELMAIAPSLASDADPFVAAAAQRFAFSVR